MTDDQRREVEGARYKAMRQSLFLSQDGLANILQVTKQLISKREKGKLKIRPEHWLAIQAIAVRASLRRSDQIHQLPRHKLGIVQSTQVDGETLE